MSLTNCVRFDSIPVPKAYFTPEGYLKDRPILTSCGIFEYMDHGKVRRELRLPEDVFDPESLRSYIGKPIVISHDAGLIDKDNVADNQVGTILSEGDRQGDDVVATIIIHDTDAMKSAGLKELSLGYNLDLDETPGVWNGQHYDARQTHIRINHLALVREARAGEQARLNLDGRAEKTILIGGKNMTKTKKRTSRADAILSDEEFEKAVEEYKKKRAAKADEADEEVEAEVQTEQPKDEFGDVEKKVAEVKERRDRRDEQGDPKDVDEAMGMIAHQDEDLDTLFDLIDTLLAKLNFDAAEEEEEPVEEEEEFEEDEIDDLEKLKGGNKDEEDVPEDEEEEDDELVEDAEDEELEEEEDDEFAEDADEDEEVVEEEEEVVEPEEDDEFAEDEDDEEEEEPNGKINMDSVDRIVSQKLRMDKLGEAVGIKGLGHKSIGYAKKAIIKSVRPGIRLDGKSAAYIDACFDMAKDVIRKNAKKDTSYQKRQMFNKKTRMDAANASGSDASRRKMVKRQMNHGK